MMDGTGGSQSHPAAAQALPPASPVLRGRVVETRRREMPHRRVHLAAWLVGVVLASLIPLGLIAAHEADVLSHPSFYQILGHGDLLIIAFTFTVAGIAELCPFVTKVRVEELMGLILMLLGAVIILAIEIGWYSDLAAEIAGAHNVPVHLITWGSIILFTVSALITTLSVNLTSRYR